MIVLDDFLESEEIAYIKNLLMNLDFRLHTPIADLGADQCMQLSNAIVMRPEEVHENENPVRSEYASYFKHLFEIFLIKAGVNCSYDILRISVNATVNSAQEASEIHEDHNYPHKQLIICLNDGFVGGATRIYDQEDNLVDRIESKPYRGYMFDSCRHSAEYPTSGIRIVVVYTFKMDLGNEARS